MKLSLVSIPVRDPIAAYQIYTSKLGFKTKQFDPDMKLAIVVSPNDPDGTAMLLEPCVGSFAENYQTSAFDANLPIMVFKVANVEDELKQLVAKGVKVRPDLDKPQWGLINMFEDGCGNLLMLEQIHSAS